MSAIVTDQFRILNAENFVNSVQDSNNSYYIFLSLPKASSPTVGFGRSSDWDTNTAGPPAPTDNQNYINHVYDTMIFGKKVTANNVKRIVKRVDWAQGTTYEMYRHDYSAYNPSAITASSRLYDANYFVMNSEFKVYICLDNGSSGSNPTGNASQDEPTFTDLEPSRAGESGDGYVWKYLYTIDPNDIIKFDSIDYIPVPNNWASSVNPQVQSIRENGDSSINENQIKIVYIDRQGFGYGIGLSQEVNILGDGTGGKVVLTTDNSGRITSAQVSSGGKDYSYGMVDLGAINQSTISSFAKLIPIIPPSKGHGYDIYKELGSDKVLLYARFDDSTKDFPIDTKFAQIGIIKNPTSIGSTSVFTENQFSSVYALKVKNVTGTIAIGDKIEQTVGLTTAFGYVASYDDETNVLKYYRDRSLQFNQTVGDQTDYVGISSNGYVVNFTSSNDPITSISGSFQASIDTNFTGITTVISGRSINLGVQFNSGLASPEINKRSGEIIYLDNRPTVSRNSRQKEDIKVILEF